MLNYLKRKLSEMDIEDYIVLIRFIAGLLYGFVAYVIYRVNLALMFDVAFTIWFLAGVVYAATVFYVETKFGYRGFFMTLLRGLMTFYLTWILVVLILYDVIG